MEWVAPLRSLFNGMSSNYVVNSVKEKDIQLNMKINVNLNRWEFDTLLDILQKK